MTAKDTVRHDGDSWDLASSVGATATAVAARRAMASKGPDPLIDDPFAEPLVNAVGVEAFIKMMNGEIELADEDPAFNPRRLAEGMAVRTRFFDTFFTEAAAAGVRQAVILAAGLDTRAYRLPWPAGTTVYEVDQPQVIEFKSRTLADLGAAPTADRKAVAVDLRDDWVGALHDNGFNSQRPTAWIAEGLLGYLPPDAQDRLFDTITTLSFGGSRIGTGYVPDIRDRIAKRGQTDQRALAPARTEHQLVRVGLRRRAQRRRGVPGRTRLADDVHTTPELYAANGFELPEANSLEGLGDIRYVSAELPKDASSRNRW